MTSPNYCCPRFLRTTPQPELSEDATGFVVLTLVSADDLAVSPRCSGRPIKVHAEVQLDGGPVAKSEADVAGGRNPTWNFKAFYNITSAHSTRGNLLVRLFYKKCLHHKFIGDVEIPLRSLLEMGLKSENVVAYPVNGNHGRLNISYEFGVAQI